MRLAGQAQDSGACGACLASVAPTSTTWGPIVCDSPTACENNAGGCVDLVLGTVADEEGQGGGGSCGDLVAAEQACDDYACGACFANDTEAAKCIASADADECASYADAESSTTGACAAIQGDAAPPAIAACFPQSDADAVAFVDVFCGTGP